MKYDIAGLRSFVVASGEDEADVNGILRQLPTYSPSTLDKVRRGVEMRILDIGAGDGNRGMNLARRLHVLGANVKIDCVEPRKQQRTILNANYWMNAPDLIDKVHPTTLEKADLRGEYDLVLSIHSLYEFPRENDLHFRDLVISGLEKAAHSLTNNGAGVIILEYPGAKLHSLKQRFYREFGNRYVVTMKNVTETFRKHKVPYSEGERIDFDFIINYLLKSCDIDIGKQLEFIFSCSMNDDPLTEDQLKRIGNWLRLNHDYKDGNHVLHASDSTLWFYKPEVALD